MVFSAFPPDRVRIGSLEHVLPIALALAFSVWLIVHSKKRLQRRYQHAIFHALGCAVSAVVLLFHLYRIGLGNYSLKTDLPLYLCSLIALLIPLFTYSRRYWMYQVLLFWIVAGTLQGTLTPDIAQGFPTFDYFRYWVVHLGLLAIIFYATFVLGMRPTFRSVFKSFFALQLYVLMMVAVNWLLDANYFYLSEKPKSASLLDFFGPWPLYILVVQLLIVPYFLVIYLPFYIEKRTNTKKLTR